MGAFGVLVGSYPMSVPAITGALLAISCWLAIFGGKLFLSARITIIVGLFVGWMAICTILSGQWSSLLSLGFFLFFSSIVIVGTQTSFRYAEVFRWLHLGGAISVLLVSIELALIVAELPSMQDYIAVGIPHGANEGSSIVRIRAGFQEPAHFAIYLAVLLMTLDMHGRRYMPDCQKSLAVVYAVALLLTWSLTGFMVLIGYWVAKRLANRTTLARAISESFAVFAICVIVFFIIGDQHWLISRILTIPEVVPTILEGGQTSGSVATRLMAITMPARLWSAGWDEAIFGLGFNAYESWVASEYYFHSFGSNQGRIHNILAGFGLGGGIPGLLLGLVLFWVCSGRGVTPLKLPIFIVLITFAFGFGSVVSYLFWWVLFAARTAGYDLTARLIPGVDVS